MNNSNNSKLQTKIKELEIKNITLTMDNLYLRHQVKELIELADALSDEDAPIPSFLKKIFDK